MKFEFVDELLAKFGFLPPVLSVLEEGREFLNYAFLQPKGNVLADKNGVKNSPSNSAYGKAKTFLEDCISKNCELVIMPEYFCPWQILSDIDNGLIPAENHLWAICFESIKPDELSNAISAFKHIKIIGDVPTNQHGTFLNPLIYIFRSKNKEDSKIQVFGLLQFKTKSMVDKALQLERGELIFGENVYVFRVQESTHLCSIVCSDALDFDPNTIAKKDDQKFGPWNHLPFILIHPQLNKSPAHQFFRKYRTNWLSQNVRDKQIICINWAIGTALNGHASGNDEFGKSSIHFRGEVTDSFSDLKESHSKGIYYTRLSRTHALFLNFNEYAFTLSSCRVGTSNINPASANNPLPRIISIKKWDSGNWIDENAVDDGYNQYCRWNPQNANHRLLTQNPPMHQLEKERLINCATASSEANSDFYNLDSVELKETEGLRRLTFCQDQSQESRDYRNLKFTIFDALLIALNNSQDFPDNIKHFTSPVLGLYKDGFNLYSNYGDFAFVCHIGTESLSMAQQRYSAIQNSIGPINSRRICVWYSEHGQLKKYYSEDYSILSASEKMTEFAKESTDEL